MKSGKGMQAMRVADFARQVARRESVDPVKTYRMLGLRLYAKGVFMREELPGSAIKAPFLFRVKAGDFIYTRLFASKGTFAMVGQEHDNCHVSGEFPTFSLNSRLIEPAYLLYLFSLPRTWRRVEALCTGTTAASRFRLKEDGFLSLRFPIPPLPEQRRVAAALASVDAAIAKTRGVIARLAAARFAVMRELLTHGHPRFRTKLVRLTEPWPIGRVAPVIDRIPAHWWLVRLTEVARLESGHTPSRRHPEYWGGDIPWVSLQDVDRLDAGEITETAESVTQAGIDNSSARVLPKGTVVFSRTASIGHCGLLGRGMATSQDFANYVCGQALLPAFLVRLFRGLAHEWDRLCAGTTHKTVYMPVFEKLQVLLPPLPEQEAIAAAGESFDRRLAAERACLARLADAKQTLAQALLSGPAQVTSQCRGEQG